MSRITVASAAALLLLVAPAVAHETGVIRLSAKQIEVGAGLSLRGEKMPKSGKVRIELRGTLATFSLGEVRTDSAGVFESNAIVPEAAKPGNYKVVVLAEDGDVTAHADLVIMAAKPSAESKDHGAMAHPEVPAVQATDEMMPLNAKSSGAEVIVIGVLVFAALAGGFALLRGRPEAAAKR